MSKPPRTMTQYDKTLAPLTAPFTTVSWLTAAPLSPSSPHDDPASVFWEVFARVGSNLAAHSNSCLPI